MLKKQGLILFSFFLVSILLIGCTDVIPDEVPFGEIIEDSVLLPEEEDIEAQARFTIMADEELQASVTALYTEYFEGEEPTFVESGADLIATRSTPSYGERPTINATFLPGSVLIPEVETSDVNLFINFAISPDGQQVLINEGELPAVITIIDQAGNQLEFQQPVRRVISAFGPATSIVYSIDAQDRLVAASFTGAGDPQGASVMERIDPRFPSLASDDFFSRQNFNIEQAASLNPDIIIGSARSTWLDVVDQLGINVFLMDAENPQELKETVLLIGELFGPHSYAQAQAWIDYYDFVIDIINSQISEIPINERATVLFTGTEPLRVASGDMYQTDIIKAAGGVSVSANLIGFWNDVNLEQIAIWEPNVIIVPPYGGASVEAITESAEWQILSAVQNGRVYRMPRLVAPWDTPGPDSVMGIVWMAERLNPELITLDCTTEAEYFYNTFLNYAISGEELAAICVIE